MVNYLVPLDGSESSRTSFLTAVSLMKAHGNPEQNKLFLLTVMEEFPAYGITSFTYAMMPPDLHERMEKEATALLRRYAQLCKAVNASFKFVAN